MQIIVHSYCRLLLFGLSKCITDIVNYCISIFLHIFIAWMFFVPASGLRVSNYLIIFYFLQNRIPVSVFYCSIFDNFFLRRTFEHVIVFSFAYGLGSSLHNIFNPVLRSKPVLLISYGRIKISWILVEKILNCTANTRKTIKNSNKLGRHFLMTRVASG